MKCKWEEVILNMAIHEFCRQRFWEHEVVMPYWGTGVPKDINQAVIWLSATGRISWVAEMQKLKWNRYKPFDFIKKNISKIFSHWEINHKKILLTDLKNEVIAKYSNIKPGEFKKEKVNISKLGSKKSIDMPNVVSLVYEKKKDRYVIIDGNHTAYFWLLGKQIIDLIYVGTKKEGSK